MKRSYLLFLLSPLLPLFFLFGQGDRAFLTRDVSIAYLPAKKFWIDSFLATHSVPGWNPLSFGGTPFRADLNNSPLHPLNFLFLLSPQMPDKGYLLFVGAHLLLLALGCYLLFRRLRFGQAGALVASLCVAVSGFSFSTMSLMNVASSLSAFPFFLYFLLALRKKFSWGQLAGMAVAWAFPIYCGDPQFSYWMAVLALSMVVQRCAHERSAAPVIRTFGAGLLAIGLSAAQMLPALRLAASSERGIAALNLPDVERFSLHPARVLELFFPMPFGNPGLASGEWLSRFTDSLFTMPFLLHVYLGLILGGASLWQIARMMRARRPSQRNLYLLVCLGLLLLTSFGKYSPVDIYAAFYALIPGWGMFRYPERLALLLIFLLTIWNGPMFRWLAGKLNSGSSPVRVALPLGLGCLALALLCFLLQRSVRILEIYTLSNSLLHSALFAALFLLFWHFRARFTAVRRYSLPIFLALIALDGLPYGFQFVWISSAHEVPFRENEFAQKIKKHLEERKGEISVGAAARYFHGTYRGPFPTPSRNPLQIGQAWDWGVMYPNVTMYFGIANPAGYSPFDPKEILGLWAKHANSDPERLLNLFSVAYYPKAEGEKPALQFNKSALPQAWFPPGITFLPGEVGREMALFAKNFPYQQRAVIKGKPGSWERKGRGWAVEEISRVPDRTTVKVIPGEGDAYFVWNERFNENWVAYFEGVKHPIAEVNTWAMGVKLEPATTGTKMLEFVYEDRAAKAGNLITLATLAFMIIVTAGIRLQPYRRSRE